MPAARHILAAASTAVAVLALAASAEAATVSTLPCIPVVSGSETMPIATAGFTPGALVTIKAAPKGSTDLGYVTSGTADAAGAFSTTTHPPSFNPFSRVLQTFNLVATDNVNPALVAAATYQQVKPGYSTNPSRGRPSRKVLHTVRGFPTGKNTYLHFRYKGQTKRNVKLGKSKGACGIVSKRMALLPTQSHPGIWIVYVDQARAFSKRTSPQLAYSLLITRTFG